jgi:CubicO group peptidase (beta-lactamase class C family)
MIARARTASRFSFVPLLPAVPLLLLLSFLIFACADREPAEAPAAPDERAALLERVSNLEAEMPVLLAEAEVPGLSVAVILDGETVRAEGFGVRRADAAEAGEVGPDTVFGAASLTKPVFAYAVMKLVDEGLIDLDRPLVEYLDYEDLAHDERARAITTRMVLSHTTGLPNWRPRHWTDDPGPLATEFEPGERWQYSGEGMVYLQRVVEELTGRPLDEILTERVFEPLGMTRSGLLWQEEWEADYALPHRSDSTPREDRRPQTALAAGTLQTTAVDYARFLGALFAGEGLADGTLEAMLTPQVEVTDGVWWGLGFGLEDGEAGRVLWQWGHDPGNRAFVLGAPESGLGMAFFANSDNGMLLLRRMIEGTVGGADHPALDHLDYESWDSPRRLVRIELERTLLEEGPGAFRERYRALRDERPEEAFVESMLNDLGYQMLRLDRHDEAIAAFLLNVEAFPDEWNPYDSLGEAYMTAGDTERAIANYERSLDLNPDNANAEEMLARLR